MSSSVAFRAPPQDNSGGSASSISNGALMPTCDMEESDACCPPWYDISSVHSQAAVRASRSTSGISASSNTSGALTLQLHSGKALLTEFLVCGS